MSVAPTSAIILAAGFATRMRPLTDRCPKAMLPLGGGPLIGGILDALAYVGITQIVVNTHYLAPLLRSYLKTYYPHVQESYEPEILETGGGVKNALPQLLPLAGDTTNSNAIWVLNADELWSQGLVPVLRHMATLWQPQKMDALLGVVQRERAIGFLGKGDYDFKPSPPYLHWRGQRAHAAFVYGGINIIKRSAYDLMDKPVFSNKQLWDLLEAQQRLAGAVIQDDWYDIGSPEGYVRAQNISENLANAKEAY